MGQPAEVKFPIPLNDLPLASSMKNISRSVGKLYIQPIADDSPVLGKNPFHLLLEYISPIQISWVN